METIIIGFSKPKKWMPYAWLIMKAYGIPYDHVYIRFYSEKFNRSLVYQASDTKVNFIEFGNFTEINMVVKEFEFNITDENRTKMIQFAIDNVGRPYGIVNALGLGIKRLFNLLGVKITNPFTDGSKSYICCELAAYILKEFDSLKIDGNIEDLSPRDLYEILSSRIG